MVYNMQRVLFLGERWTQSRISTVAVVPRELRWPLHESPSAERSLSASLSLCARSPALGVVEREREGSLSLGAETRSREANNFAEFTRGVQLGKWASGLLLYCLFSVAQIYFDRTFAIRPGVRRCVVSVAAASSLMAAAPPLDPPTPP